MQGTNVKFVSTKVFSCLVHERRARMNLAAVLAENCFSCTDIPIRKRYFFAITLASTPCSRLWIIRGISAHGTCRCVNILTYRCDFKHNYSSFNCGFTQQQTIDQITISTIFMQDIRKQPLYTKAPDFQFQ